ncbi:alpha-2B adrenergic receptor [Aplochiton taeniatus]
MAAGFDVSCLPELPGGTNKSLSSTSRPGPCNQSTIRTPPYSPEATAVFAIAITLMMVLTIVGNILVIMAVLTSRLLRGPQNLFLVSLAAADILVATLIIPFSLANELQGYWAFRSLWCEIYLALDVLFCTSSIVHLCAISLDRYLSISRPVSYGARRTPLRIKTAIVVVWLISAVISFPPLLSLDKSKGGAEVCELNSERWYILYSTIGSFFAPCLIMILVYVRIYQIAKQHTRCPPGEKRKEVSVNARPAIPDAELKTVDQPQHNGEQAGKATDETVPAYPPPSPSGHPGPQTDQPPFSTAIPGPAQALASFPTSHSNPPPNNQCQVSSDPRRPQEHHPEEGPVHPEDHQEDTSSSSSDAEIEVGRGGRRGGKNKEAGQKTIEGLFQGKGFKGQVMHLAQRYKSTVATPAGTRLASEDSPKAQGTPMSRRKAMVNREKRFTFVLAVVIGVFVVCWFPFFFSYSLQAVCPESCTLPEPLFKFFFWIGYCNSCLNPVIYTIFNKDFRKAFKKILCRDIKGTFF